MEIWLYFGIKINNNPKVIINKKDMREAGFEPAHPEIVSERFYTRMWLY